MSKSFRSSPRLADLDRTSVWLKLVLFVLVGYLMTSRSFAYLGIPPLNIYIGEVSLVAFLLFGPRMHQQRWLCLAWKASRLKRFSLLLLLFLSYGIFQALRGTLAGYPALVAVRDTAFNYYPLFLFLGVWIGLRHPDSLRKLVRTVAWWNGCYGLAYVLFLSRFSWRMPGTASVADPVPFFGQPIGSALALLGLMGFEPELGRVWYLIAANSFVLLCVGARAEWAGFVTGLLLFGWCAKRIKRLAFAASVTVALLATMYVANIRVPAPEGRPDQISMSYILGRGLAPINEDAAYELTGPSNAKFFAGTTTWRLVWWAAIWEEVHRSVSSALFGFGYGYPIGDLNPLIEPGVFIQTPHNDFLYALGFSGWIGVALFVLLQVALGRLLVGAYRATGQPFGLMCWTALLTASLFEDFLEAPFGAIPFYLLAGMALAPGLLSAKVALPRAGALPIPPRARAAES